MKKRKSPISVGRIQLYAYGRHEEGDISFIDQFTYDDRRDFVIDKNFAGIAVKIGIYNERYDKGARRNISVSIVDMSTRHEVASHLAKVIIHKDMIECNVCINFSVGQILFVAGHTYRLIVNDIASSVTLYETMFRLFDQRTLGHPSKWYTICHGAVRPSWESTTYKVLDTIDCHDYYVRFNVVPKFSWFESPVLPELELRLYYPNGEQVNIDFREPKSYGRDDYKDGIKTVEFPFCTCDDANGVFYAELLCMEYPVAGFVFDTKRENTTGVWGGHEIKPLREYSLRAAKKRLAKLLPIVPKSKGRIEDDHFDQLLDEFIASQIGCENKTEDKFNDNGLDSEEILDGEEIDTEEKDSEPEIDTTPLISLDNLTGLKSVKQKLSVYESLVRFNKMRSEKGLPTPDVPLHAMFLGSPGTGKTTVAKRMGQMLHRVGVLSKGHVVVKERATLLGQNYASESENTVKALEEAQGGILFIDEAYQLYQRNDPRDPGKFVIETLFYCIG